MKNKTCTVHVWPNGRAGKLFRGQDSVEHLYCANCIAIKISFTTIIEINGRRVTLMDEKVIEPQYNEESIQ